MRIQTHHHGGTTTLILGIALALGATGCATTDDPDPTRSSLELRDDAYCFAQEPEAFPEYQLRGTTDPVLDTTRERFSAESIDMAERLGVIRELNAIATAESDETGVPGQRRDTLAMRQHIAERMQLANMEVLSMVGMLDCEEERGDQISFFLKEQEDQRIQRITIQAIAVAGVTTVASGGVALAGMSSTAPEIIAMAGGLTEVGLGWKAWQMKEEIEYGHPVNPLREIHEAPGESELFSPLIWTHLNSRRTAGPRDGLTPRERLIDQWNQLGLLGPDDSQEREARKALLFGDGGVYDARTLEIRNDMIDDVEAAIELLMQDLVQLSRELWGPSPDPEQLGGGG